jgi:CheY-like chemotaxis protein
VSSDARSRATTALNILVVEDETIVALDLMATLEQLGHNPTGHALSGEEALAEICAQRPDLVLMDIRIQGDLDGIQTAQRIRNAYGIPVIFLTAFSDPSTTQRAEDAGMAGLLRKPFSRQQLQDALRLIQQKPQ